MLHNFLQSTWQTEYAKSNNICIIQTDDINQNILAVLRTLSNLQKKFMKNSISRPKLQLLNFLAKFLTEKKYLMKTLTLKRLRGWNPGFLWLLILSEDIFPGNFIEFPQVVQKIWTISLSILTIFIHFHRFFGFFNITLLQRN